MLEVRALPRQPDIRWVSRALFGATTPASLDDEGWWLRFESSERRVHATDAANRQG
jgi:hypothetical protein